MLSALKRAKPQSDPQPFQPRGPAGRRLYAIGDVHGRLDLLHALLEQIDADIRTRPSGEIVLAFLGDLIDRGPDSRGVIDLVRSQPIAGARTVTLKGNHEDCLVRGLNGEPALLADWLGFGGYECAQSYGVEIGALFGRAPAEIEPIIAQAVPLAHLQFMEASLDSARFGDYLLVHAGVRPGVALADQRPHDLRWIRKEFLDSAEPRDFMVVHGHSVSPDVDERSNRICIDTGAYRTGVLTAIWIEGDQRGYLQTRAA
jgi:serine/threonine protein phosphatase 1